MTCAGLKKWVPTTASGRRVAAAISFTSSEEVFVASTASGFATLSRRAKTSRLTPISSNTASTKKSAPPRSSNLSARRIRAVRRSASAASIFPLPTARERLPATAASPRAHASPDSSNTVTGIPAAAKESAIPRPMVPKPTNPADSTARPLTPSGIRRDRAASFSA